MAAQTSRAGAGTVQTTQPIVDLARGNNEEEKKDKDSGGGKGGEKGKGNGKGNGKGRAREEEAGTEGREGFEGDGWEEGEVERGMLNALVELGHLEMLLHQVLLVQYFVVVCYVDGVVVVVKHGVRLNYKSHRCVQLLRLKPTAAHQTLRGSNFVLFLRL